MQPTSFHVRTALGLGCSCSRVTTFVACSSSCCRRLYHNVHRVPIPRHIITNFRHQSFVNSTGQYPYCNIKTAETQSSGVRHVKMKYIKNNDNNGAAADVTARPPYSVSRESELVFMAHRTSRSSDGCCGAAATALWH